MRIEEGEIVMITRYYGLAVDLNRVKEFMQFE